MKSSKLFVMGGASAVVIATTFSLSFGRSQARKPGLDAEILVARALALGSQGTSVHLTARQLAVIPEREQGEAGAAISRLRTRARSLYDQSQSLYREAQDALEGSPPNDPTRQFYEAAIAYTRTLWTLSGEAAPVDEPAGKTGATGKLEPTDVATVEVINGAVGGAVDGFLTEQLARFVGPPDGDSIKALARNAHAVADASKDVSLRFPGVPEEKLAEAKARLGAVKAQLQAAGARLDTAKKTASRIKAEAKEAKSEGETDQAKALKKTSKAAGKVKEGLAEQKKDVAKVKEKASQTVEEAKAARENEIGQGVEPTVETLAAQARDLILILHTMTEQSGPAPEESKSNE